MQSHNAENRWDCDMSYDPDFLDPRESQSLFRFLCEDTSLTQSAQIGELTLDYGLHFYADQDLTGFDKLAEAWGPRTAWPKELRPVKDRIHQLTGYDLRVCRCVYYPDGNAGVDFHSDLPAYGDTSCIASLSLGEEREFLIRRQSDKKTRSIVLASGSLLIMGQNFQTEFEHALPTSNRYANPRINLTFRCYGWSEHIGPS